ncbi:MAG: hypothetical protein AB7S26_08310 [Sandaracinaceae bacterium]
MLTAPCGVAVAAGEAEDERDRGAERGARGDEVVVPAGGAALERTEEMERLARVGTGRDDADHRALGVARELGLADAPGGQVLLP